jgi:prolyl-tRNA editing enzyme YbaK/EbsC (Cys-tRNA(Pro) deacylase)
VVLATCRVNNVVKRSLDVRKASFLPLERAVELSGMEYGGITPIGLPESWLLLIDRRVVDTEIVVVGSGVRRSKLLVPGHVLSRVRGATIVDGLGLDAS